MAWIKALHLLCIFMWLGTLLSLTRFMGYHPKEDVDTQMRMAKLYKRIYKFIQFPSMVVAVALGLFLLTKLDLGYKPGWMHMKLTFAFGLILCDFWCGRCIKRLNIEPELGRGVKFKILHGVTGLLLIGVLISGIVVRDKVGEIKYQLAKSESTPYKGA
jgi:putative membrane protein